MKQNQITVPANKPVNTKSSHCYRGFW